MNPDLSPSKRKETTLNLLAAAAFLIFFQAYMVAPLVPLLAQSLKTTEAHAGLLVPAYLIPYGLATLVYGILADRIGIHRVMYWSLGGFVVLTAVSAAANTIDQLIVLRVITGAVASGVVPLALALVGRLYSFTERGRTLGWLFGAMAGGMAFGVPLGAILAPVISWRGLFLVLAGVGAVLFAVLLPVRGMIAASAPPSTTSFALVTSGYRGLLRSFRGYRTYAYVLVNSIFHSGVFTWLGLYLLRDYKLGSIGIGLALLGYGIPGFLLGPFIGRLADRWGRARLIPWGLLLGGTAAIGFAMHPPIAALPVHAIALSLAYDMTQPLFAGIVTTLQRGQPGQAMGLNVCTLFIGSGLGSMIFAGVLNSGFTSAFLLFAIVELIVGVVAFALFRREVPVPA